MCHFERADGVHTESNEDGVCALCLVSYEKRLKPMKGRMDPSGSDSFLEHAFVQVFHKNNVSVWLRAVYSELLSKRLGYAFKRVLLCLSPTLAAQRFTNLTADRANLLLWSNDDKRSKKIMKRKMPEHKVIESR